MLRYYIDHNFHADIVRGLRRRNIDCLTAAEDGYRRAKDPALLSRATELARVLVTHDDDFSPSQRSGQHQTATSQASSTLIHGAFESGGQLRISNWLRMP